MFSTSNGPTLVYTSPYEKPGFFVPPIASVSDNPIKNETHELKHRQWSSNLCDCCIDSSSCLYAFTCPCMAFSKISNHIREENNCCSGSGRCICCCIMPCSVFITSPYRKQFRVKYNLPAKPCNDCCVSLWCPCCSISQQLREIKYQAKPKLEQMKI